MMSPIVVGVLSRAGPGNMSCMTQPVEESEWAGLVMGQRRQPDVIRMAMMVRAWHGGGVAGSFCAADQSGRRWWVKPPEQGELDQALPTEYVVGRLGQLIGAPTCENAIFEITNDFHDEYRPGVQLAPGLGHATLEVVAAQEERPHLLHRDEDANPSRHPGIFALYDWCWGADEQWLIATTSDNSTFSHDHGWYFPPSGPAVTVDELRRCVDLAHPLGQPAAGLDPEAVKRVAMTIERVGRDDLLDILRTVPARWPVTEVELETMGWFLERRVQGVAARLRSLI
jgi:hypothetical protein